MDKNMKYNLSNPNPHLDPNMRDYVMDLWMRGVSPEAIDRMVWRKLSRERGWNKKNSAKSDN